MNTEHYMANMTLVPVDATSAVAVTDYLTKARDWLATAVETSTPHGIADAKAELSVAAEATKQLGLSKEIRGDAVEMVRRAEYALAKSVRQGQAKGVIAAREDNLSLSRYRTGTPDNPPSSPKPVPTDFFNTKDERSDAYAMAAVDDFEEVIHEAKAEGNLTRTNVARIAREKSGKPPVDDSRAMSEAHVLNAFRVLIRRTVTPKNLATLSPKARDLMVQILQDAITTIEGVQQ